jgi:hypothetical protein
MKEDWREEIETKKGSYRDRTKPTEGKITTRDLTCLPPSTRLELDLTIHHPSTIKSIYQALIVVV